MFALILHVQFGQFQGIVKQSLLYTFSFPLNLFYSIFLLPISPSMHWLLFCVCSSAVACLCLSFCRWYLLAAQSCLHTGTHHKIKKRKKFEFHVGNTPFKYSRFVTNL